MYACICVCIYILGVYTETYRKNRFLVLLDTYLRIFKHFLIPGGSVVYTRPRNTEFTKKYLREALLSALFLKTESKTESKAESEPE